MQARRGPEFSLQSWGANSYGQLGHGGVEDRPVPGLCDAAALKDKAVRVVTGGGGHTAVITEDGEVFVCGQNHRGQLGLGHLTDISTLQRCLGLTQTVTNVTCGWDFTLFLTDSGRVLSCGSNAFGQLGIGQKPAYTADVQIVESLKAAVVSVAAGLRHSLAVTDSGCVYQWGIGLMSQAKRTLSPSPVPSHLSSVLPSLVPGLNQKMSRVVAAGSMHCVCLTENGDLFLWGSNKHSQLLSSEPFLSSPTPVERSLLGGETVLRVWSGWTHIVAQTETGRVFTWGRGNYGQLGRHASTSQSSESQSTTEDQEVRLPEEVPALQGATQVFSLFLAKAHADTCSNSSRQPSTVFQYELMKQHFCSTFQLQSDERETRKQLTYLQTQSSLTLFVLCSFELSAAPNKAAFILTYGFLFPFRAGIVCRASRSPCVRSK
ncbi:secretion-regulating guanine nucleotide exchange factor isoform X1 [Takifugu flavidus]|uniref:secretion-regulating guanine nucleotide exchange factor isoform X1 n=1 Tax=Takifugu flavidus TaxID=433684 RepID=UPI00254435AF|nr:secretion-regulating guanine nucleotide exchange factor isoform X1 [Takifugu flavidus]